MITHMKSLFAGTLASFALLTLVASPSRAESRTTTANAIKSSSTEQQISQTKTPSSPTQQQPDDKGCPCCKKMMGNMQQMDNKMHQMMDSQQNPSRR